MDDDFDLPFQSHSPSSYYGSKRPRPPRITAQEQWVYETLQKHSLADWQLWQRVERTNLFDKLSSMRRARIGLLWVNRRIGPTPYHPIEDSGVKINDPETNVLCVIWQMKPLYLTLPYEQWVERYKALAREHH